MAFLIVVHHRLIKQFGGSLLKVNDAEIRHAQALLQQHEGVLACEAGSAALAGYMKLVQQLPPDAIKGPVLVNVTGGRRHP